MSKSCLLTALICALIVLPGFGQQLSEESQEPEMDASEGAQTGPGVMSSAALLQRAEGALRQKDYPEALKLYQAAQRLEPSNAELRVKIMDLQSRMRTASIPIAPLAKGSATQAIPAVGGKGGSTRYTESMPLDLQSLIDLRRRAVGRPEFRGAWITRMQWASPDPEKIRTNITRFMDAAKKLRLNAVLFQVRGETTTLYPSTLEPWSALMGGRDPGFDPLKFAIAEAHSRGLEFHAYFNLCTASENRDGMPVPSRAWTEHCQPNSSPNWLVFENGRPAPFKEYFWLNPNLPEVQTYIRQAAVDLVTRYEVDGLHYDRCRFPANTVSDDPWSKARCAGAGNPNRLGWHEWQRDNLTRLLTDIYGSVTAIRPSVKVSAAVWGIYDKSRLPQGDKKHGYSWTSSGLQNYNQDSIRWTQVGCVDALVPMIYWGMGGDKPDYDELLAWFRENAANGRHVYGGQAVFSGIESLREAVAGSLVGAQGSVPFTLGGILDKRVDGFWRTNINPDAVPAPAMAWKLQPSTGVILVFVRNEQGQPVTDAQVRMPGRNEVWLSSADGFCAIIDAAPSQACTLSATHIASGTTAASPSFAVIPGKPMRVDLLLRAGGR